MARLWQKGLMVASKWAYKVAREGITIPIPQAVIDRLSAGLAQGAVQDLRIRPQADSHLVVTGRKKVGVWLEFSAVFRIEPPASDESPRSLVLVPERIQPLPARSPMLGAMAALNGVERDGDRLRLNLDRLMADHEWGRRVPAAVRERVRITGVSADAERIRIRLRFSRHAAA
ncbi:MAG TPA: hypothetical protein VKA64_06100 [Gammaproteobacteria bacterium]|nr:hypothetical protein [Gammaproteobacteria bacterium]